MDEQYVSLKDASERLGVKRPSLYHYIEVLKLEKHRFPLDRQTYLSLPDFQRIQTLKAQVAQRNETKEFV